MCPQNNNEKNNTFHALIDGCAAHKKSVDATQKLFFPESSNYIKGDFFPPFPLGEEPIRGDGMSAVAARAKWTDSREDM